MFQPSNYLADPVASTPNRLLVARASLTSAPAEQNSSLTQIPNTMNVPTHFMNTPLQNMPAANTPLPSAPSAVPASENFLEPERMLLYVGGLPVYISHKDLFDIFSKYGTVLETKLLPNKYVDNKDKIPRAIAFVRFVQEQDVENAIAGMNGAVLFDQRTQTQFKVHCKHAHATKNPVHKAKMARNTSAARMLLGQAPPAQQQPQQQQSFQQHPLPIPRASSLPPNYSQQRLQQTQQTQHQQTQHQQPPAHVPLPLVSFNPSFVAHEGLREDTQNFNFNNNVEVDDIGPGFEPGEEPPMLNNNINAQASPATVLNLHSYVFPQRPAQQPRASYPSYPVLSSSLSSSLNTSTSSSSSSSSSSSPHSVNPSGSFFNKL